MVKMKKLILAISAVLMQLNLTAQNNGKVFLFTDRNMYVAGEQILFSALLHSDQLSKVLYCELLEPDGRKITGEKFYVDASSAAGSLAIPQGIASGIYYLRAYTKFMRNDGPASFPYVALKIVNPYRNEVLNDLQDTAEPDSFPAVNADSAYFRILVDHSRVIARDSLHISISPEKVNPEFMSMVLSVVPFSSYNNQRVNVKAGIPDDNDLLPEVNGISLTGSVRDRQKGTAIKGIRVNLSVIGEGRDFMAMRTDSAGHFSFSLRGYYGSRDLFLGTERSEKYDPQLLVDNDFSSAPVKLSAGSFTLSSEEREAAYSMAVNFQVDSAFSELHSPLQENSESVRNAAFYGTPDETIVLDEYVQLPSLEEYFNELPTFVKVRKRGGQKYFKVLGSQTELTEIDPLVMVDLVAVDDPETVLAANPRDISKIEVVNAVYVKGDQLYGGIINIISRAGDFAGIDLPSSGLFVRYEFPDKSSPENDIMPAKPFQPDARNTVLWIPHFKFEGMKRIPFVAPDTPGRYIVIVRAVTSNGDVIKASASFEVSSKK
jgi:hypothetical protein